jgi:LmbE family N-acetylglucosaminyl deacetylase
MKNVLVFAPHPDDESIGCGGSIAKHVKSGSAVTIAFFTSEGKRKDEAKDAARILGASKIEFMDFKDGFLSYSQETVEKTAKILENIKPDIVYIPHEFDGNADHMNAFKIVLEVLKKFYHGKPTVLCYEVWTPIKNPNYYEDITDFADVKKKAIEAHKSQLSKFNFSKAALSLNSYRGIMSGSGEISEAFMILKFGGSI